MKKPILYSEFAYVFGVVFVAVGVALMEKADFGVSMVVAPAYVFYRWLNPVWSFFSFGMAEYCLQAVLLLAMALVLRRFRVSYLLSLATAVIYGFVLDGCMLLAVYLPANAILFRVLWYVLGILICSAGVSMMFHTYLSPEVYELFVKEVSSHFGVEVHRFKTGYDIVSCLTGLVLSFLCFGFGRFVGVKWGTTLCAAVNGFIIGAFSRFYEKAFIFCDLLPWRPFFTGETSISDPRRAEIEGGNGNEASR